MLSPSSSRQPLLRLLAINLAGGITVAALLVGGLLALNPFELRRLIFADGSPGTAIGLLLFGFVVTFGSAAMGSAIMALGYRGPGGGTRRSVPPSAAMVRQLSAAARGRQRP